MERIDMPTDKKWKLLAEVLCEICSKDPVYCASVQKKLKKLVKEIVCPTK